MYDDYPGWICSDCGIKHGRGFRNGDKVNKVATWHYDKCDVCGQNNVMVTEPRDFGHLRNTWKQEEVFHNES